MNNQRAYWYGKYTLRNIFSIKVINMFILKVQTIMHIYNLDYKNVNI